MTLQEFQKKYNFTENLTKKDVRSFIILIMTLMLDMSTRGEDEKPRIELFLDDAKSLFIP